MRAARGAAWAFVAPLVLCRVAPALAQRSDSAMARAGTVETALIQPGDRIALKVWREKELSDTLTVDENAMLVLPRLGPFSVARQTVGSLQDSLRARYAEYLRNPSIEVTVLRRIGVHGEVKKPGLYWVDVTVTLRDVIALAGGLTDIGSTHKVRIMRGSESRRIADWEAGGARAADLRSGDQVVVGRTSWLSRNMLSAVTAAGIMTSIIVTVFRL